MLKNQWLQIELDRVGKSQSALARHLGLDASRINETAHGKRQVKSAEIPLIAGFLGRSESEIVAMIAGKPPSDAPPAIDPFTAAVIAVEAFARDVPLSPQKKAELIQRIDAELRRSTK